MRQAAAKPWLIYASLASVYLIWGSSFAVSKYMVGDLPPFLAAGLRFTGAGLLILLLAHYRGEALPRERREWRHCLVMGIFQVVGAAGVNVFAMQHVASNQSALLNASGALWISLLGALGARGHRLTALVSSGICLGFIGVGLLVWPHDGFSFSHFGWQMVIIAACLSWALGSIYYQRAHTRTPMLVFTGVTMLIGGCLLTAMGFVFHEAARWHWHLGSMSAVMCLMLGSSCIGYTAFNYLTRYTSPALLSTYAYVNPAIAALVGWLALNESMSGHQLIGMGIILVGVILVSLGEPAAGHTQETPSEASA
jgi:hypothetical protein